MAEIDIRKLKGQASKVLDEIQTQGAHRVITRRGRPVGVLVPLEDAPSTDRPGVATGAAWSELERLGEEIGRGWRSRTTSDEVLAEVRGERQR